jgi:hypothetical protein
MSGLFGGKTDRLVKQQMEMQRQANERESARIKKQEDQLAEAKTEEAMRMQAQARARRRGGQRALLSAERMDAEAGVPQLVVME